MDSTIVARHQSATTFIDGRRLPLGAFAIAVAVAVMATTLTLVPGLGRPISAPADASYTQVEELRANIFGTGTFDAYTQAESVRGAVFGSGAVAGPADGSYAAVESNRSQLTLPAPARDRSYDQVEQLRGQLGR